MVYHGSDSSQLLQGFLCDQFGVFPVVRLCSQCGRTAGTIFRENITDFIEILSRTGRLMENQLIKSLLIFVKGITSFKEAVQPMGCCDDIIKCMEGIKPNQANLCLRGIRI